MVLMLRGYTTEDVLKMLRYRQGEKTQREFAAEIEITQQHLSDVLAGNRGPGTKILAYLGLEPGFIKGKVA
jgi:transcriptional regulator with XRE-family HTH domain